MFIRRTVPLACAAVALGFAGCGGEDSDPVSAPPSATQAVTTTEATPTPQPAETTPATTAAPGTKSAGGKTRPGTTLKLGKTAHVTREPLNAPTDSKAFYKIDVTVLDIEQGTLESDFQNIELDPDQKKSTPYYVKVRIRNPGSKVPADDDPALGLDAIDDRGQQQGRLIFLGAFERCEYTTVPKPLAKGKTYETCLVYLMPGGGSIEEVHWTGDDGYFSEPVVWK